LKKILALLKAHGYKRVSLSIQKANYAARIYQKVGFEIVRENEEEWYVIYKPKKGYAKSGTTIRFPK